MGLEYKEFTRISRIQRKPNSAFAEQGLPQPQSPVSGLCKEAYANLPFRPFRKFEVAKPSSDGEPRPLAIELFVQPEFSQLELASVTSLLKTANEVQRSIRFDWNFRSDTSGLIASGNFLVQAEPLTEGNVLKDCLIVVGGDRCNSRAWMKRIRAMQRHNRPVVLLSDAATEFVRTSPQNTHSATTHWRDIPVLTELGHCSGLSTRLAEHSNGVLTCAGRGHTLEVVFGMISGLLSAHERSEIASLLIMDGVRGFHREQPKGKAQGNDFLEDTLRKAIHLMEETIENPLSMRDLANEIGVSSRHLERLFRTELESSPAKFYKEIRVKRAWLLIVETRMTLLEVAIACGFSSASSLSKPFKRIYGKTPKQIRVQRG